MQALSSRVARPFLKMAGGKTALLNDILLRLPRKINTYYEPFVGGGAVFFALAAEKRFKQAQISDVNVELMNTYRAVAYETDAVVERLEEHDRHHGKTYYYSVRASEPRTTTARAARMIYLNKTCFNGLHRVNKSGQFNVPFGDYKNPTICDEENLRAVADTIGNDNTVFVTDHDFEEAVKNARRGDAAYFDCPYWPVSESANFTNYTKEGFGADDQRRLRDCALRLKKKGVHVLLSNADVPPVRALYAKDFKLHEVSVKRRINSDATRRGAVGELLIM